MFNYHNISINLSYNFKRSICLSISLMFKDVNDEIKKGNIYDALILIKDIWIKFPKNTKIFEEVQKLKKKCMPNLQTSLNQNSIKKYFELHKIGQTNDVINDLELINKRNPNDFYVLNLLGTFHGLLNNYQNAKKFQKLALSLNLFDQNNYLNLALTLKKQGELNDALILLEIGKILDIKNLIITQQLAEMYYFLNKLSLSLRAYEDLIYLDHKDYTIKLDYVRTLIKAEKAEEAITFLKKIKNKDVQKDKWLTLEGLANFKLNNVEIAIRLINDSISENPNNSDSFVVLGSIYESLNQTDKALTTYLKATELNEKNHIAFNNLAACYAFIGEVDLSILNFKKAINIEPLFYDGIYRLGQMQVYNKNFEEGWKNFKKRWQSSDYFHKSLKTSKPILENLEDQTLKILTWNEQGLGDQVMYGSMFDELSKFSSKLLIKLDKRLIKIFQELHPKIQFVDADEFISEDQYDKHVPFGNLGNHFRLKTKHFIKPKFPYISGNRKTSEYINKKYKEAGTLLVGLSWSSSNYLLSDNKSLSLETLYPILSIKNIKFIDLEYKNSFKEVNDFHKKYGIKIFKEDTVDNYNDIEGLCSIIDACDFVISCSNTNAHLSGALSKKTFLLLAKGKGRLWNWSTHNGYSLWYPRTKIFQQETVGNWTSPINKLKAEILNHGNNTK